MLSRSSGKPRGKAINVEPQLARRTGVWTFCPPRASRRRRSVPQPLFFQRARARHAPTGAAQQMYSLECGAPTLHASRMSLGGTFTGPNKTRKKNAIKAAWTSACPAPSGHEESYVPGKDTRCRLQARTRADIRLRPCVAANQSGTSPSSQNQPGALLQGGILCLISSPTSATAAGFCSRVPRSRPSQFWALALGIGAHTANLQRSRCDSAAAQESPMTIVLRLLLPKGDHRVYARRFAGRC